MRILVVANPQATGVTPRERDVLAHALASEGDLEVVETANRGHAAALACRAMRRGVEVVVALGGDGTVSEVVNGMLTDGVHAGVPALGIVPAGSTNVFARALGLPHDPVEATGVLLDGLRAGRHRRVSLGRIEERYFVFAAGMGFDAAIVAGVERHRRRGRRSSHVLYSRVGIREFFALDRRHPHLSVEQSDGTCVTGVFFAVVANCDPWTFVGNRPLHPTPEASFETGLDVYARRRMSTGGVLFSMARMSGENPRIGRRGAHVGHDLDAVVLRSQVPLPVQVDGDFVGLRETVRLAGVPGAIQVVGVSS
ncbi:MAG: diacylglycerol kinase family lipid kinase [Jatrophihabitans sp.]|nr:MAG: diacylglycerol kinase family lipid kinase [Jatrophihabitans sp.]